MTPHFARIAAVLDIIETLWHCEAVPPHLGHDEPLDGLILTVLSQNTNDRNRDVAYGRLRSSFPSWDLVAQATPEAVADAIRPAGIANNKSRRILEILAAVHRTFGVHSIASLRNVGAEKARVFLEALPGVGVKTAACVLLFDLGFPAFPVDTHVARVTRRIGLVPEKMKEGDISRLFEQLVPPERQQGGHLNFIEHGRHLCKAQRPQCALCPVQPKCHFCGGVS